MTILSDEITNDPLGRGYAGMTDAQVADSLNTADRTVERSTIAGSEIFNAIVPGEFSALSADTKDLVRDVFNLGDRIDVTTGTNARTVLLNAFGSGTTTRSNLVSVVEQTISRAQELGLGTVTELAVKKARE